MPYDIRRMKSFRREDTSEHVARVRLVVALGEDDTKTKGIDSVRSPEVYPAVTTRVHLNVLGCTPQLRRQLQLLSC